MGMRDLKPFAHFANKYDEGEFGGAIGTYKLMYALGNLIRTNGVSGLIFDGEINHDMAYSLDATAEEREEREQGLEVDSAQKTGRPRPAGDVPLGCGQVDSEVEFRGLKGCKYSG